MRYTKQQILVYGNSFNNAENLDETLEFIADGGNVVSSVESNLADYYYNTFNMLSYPSDLDILLEFIIAGALELCEGTNEGRTPVMPSYKEVIREIFNDDMYTHAVCDKYFSSFSQLEWQSFWYNAWGDGRAVYYQIIRRFEILNGPQTSIADALISYRNNCTSLSVSSDCFPHPDDLKNIQTWLINPSEISICVSRLYMMLCGEEENMDRMLQTNLFHAELDGLKFDRIVCDAIPTQRIFTLAPAEKEYLEQLGTIKPYALRSNSAGWLYAHKISKLLSNQGKAAIVMPTNSLSGKREMKLRQFLIENRMIEAVINLPQEKVHYENYPEYFSNKTKMPLSIVILSKGSEEVKTIDADSLMETDPDTYYDFGPYNKSFKTIYDKALIKTLKALLENDISEDISYERILTEEDLIESGYDLNCLRYTKKDSLISDGVAFGKVIKSIRRGASPKEGIKSEMPTNYYQMGSNISEVVTTVGLNNIEEPEDKLRKYCLRNGNLVITKNGVPKRAGIVEIENYEMILATDNCYIVELDTDMINPYYLAAYLNSDRGRKALEKISTGSVIKTISVADLKELLVPCPSLKEQKSTAEKYEDTLKELHMLRIREAELQDSLSNIFYEEE